MKNFSRKFSSIVSIILLYSTFSEPKRTMMGEPLNPGDFENSLHVEGKVTSGKYDDGTASDIKANKIPANLPGTTPAGIRLRTTKLWPNGIVPYLLDSSFSRSDRAMIAKSIEVFHEVTCLRVVARTTEADYVVLKKSEDRYCGSNVGMQGGRQSISLAQRCVDAAGSTVHEFMHLIGFQHEQSREDRDTYVNVHFEHIQPGAEVNFKKQESWINRLGPYDRRSIVHYSNYAFSKNGYPTLEPKGRAGNLGQRVGLTQIDIDKINKAYNCSRKNSKLKVGADPGDTLKGGKRNATSACEDFDVAYCRKWSSMDHCAKSPMFMTVYCQKACGKCGIKCSDMRRECSKWARLDYCNEYPDYMLYYCKHSCGMCNY